MNKATLLTGAATMIVIGLITQLLGNDNGVTFVAVGLGLYWQGVAINS